MSRIGNTTRRLAAGVATGAMLMVGAGAASAAPCAPGTAAPAGTLGVEYVLDNSSSIWEGVLNQGIPPSDPTGLRGQASKTGIGQLANGDTVSVAKFSLTATSVIPPTVLTTDRAALLSAIDAPLAAKDRGTDYDSAFKQAKIDIDNMCAAKKIVIFLSDGVPYGTGSDTGLHKLVGVPIYTVALGTSPGARLQAIATETGGKFIQAAKASDIDDSFAQALSAAGVSSTAVAPGAVVDIPITIPVGTPSIGATASWPSGAFKVSLVGPAGVIDSQATAPAPSIVQIGATLASFQIVNPVAGPWTLRIQGAATNTAAANVLTRIVVAPAAAGTPTTAPPVGTTGVPKAVKGAKITGLRGLKSSLTRGIPNAISFSLSQSGPVKISFIRSGKKRGAKVLTFRGKTGRNTVKLPATFVPATSARGVFNVVVTPTGGTAAKVSLILKK